MSRAVLVLRPAPGAEETARAAEALGLAPVVAPLFTVRPIAWTPPPAPPEAILMTSANAAREGGAALAAYRALPVYAVGAATAEAARAAGFSRIIAGEAGIEAIVARAEAEGVTRLLHLAGREHRPARAEVRIVYAADAVETLPEAARQALPQAVALLHSPRAAARFAALVESRGDVAVAAISARALAAAGPGWRATAIAARPTDRALLAAAAKLCDQGKDE
ncbi:uroporphyrinogen-III synthase [Sphingomonas morindae]|uniref:Uroporphyrinogen-III synthase n=1 Tax=Sphingomonas morindae TaxID=1541170 RepID=A0ABY4XBL9_9SPHN|nr:uroporphyrinogen-III synthase [Sphingomonas morindae]USI74279.1 uroporphyrinogen-III synthase [Sphingomonas morindae]